MSEHTVQKVISLPVSVTKDQLLAQLYDLKESANMLLLVVERDKKELRAMTTKIQNAIALVEGLAK